MLEELVKIRTGKLKVVKERIEADNRSLASMLESLEADTKRLEQLKKEVK